MNAKHLLVWTVGLLALVCLAAAIGAGGVSALGLGKQRSDAAPPPLVAPHAAFNFEIAASSPLTTPTPFSTNPPTSTATPTAVPPTATRTVTPIPTTSPTPTPCPMNFSDVHPGDFFYEDLRYLYCRGAVSGYSDGTFRPGNRVILGQAVKMMVLAFNVPIYNPPSFCNIPPTDPFYVYIASWYYYYYGGPPFECDINLYRSMTRGQLTKVLVTTACWPIDVSGGGHFTDVPPTDPFYVYIETTYNRGVISGYADHTFRPFNTITRGQITKMIHRAAVQAECTPRPTPIPTVAP